jgi:tetratricopeptide (TPR) repeat protein
MRRDRYPSRLIVAAVLSGVVACAQTADAAGADDALALGQQAYASGDRAKASQLLSEAIQHDPHDPRPYYLRALCLARAGHPAQARANLVIAAALETRNPDRYPVSETIPQLTNSDRALVNQYRLRSQTADVALALDRGEMAIY